MEKQHKTTPSHSHEPPLSPRRTPLSLLPKPRHLQDPPLASPFLRPAAPAARRAGDAELSIFGAERYFRGGGGIGDDDPRERCFLPAKPRDSSASSVSRAYGGHCRIGSGATPTASSEASWNSRSGLLSNPPPGSLALSLRNFPLRDHSKVVPPSPGRRLLRLSCLCARNKSFDIDEKSSEPRSPICPVSGSSSNYSVTKKQSTATGEIGPVSGIQVSLPAETKNELGAGGLTKVTITPGIWPKGEDFIQNSTLFSPKLLPFPVEIGCREPNPGRPFNFSGRLAVPVAKQPINSSAEDPPRDSLEVFRPLEEPAALRKSAELRCGMQRPPFSGDAGHRSFTCPSRTAAALDDEVGSDASSDLFELESLATSYRRCDPLDELLDARRGLRRRAEESAPSECLYPPSEASVVWSVATAEGFDRGSVANFSSAASDCTELRFIQAEHDRFAAAMGGASKKGGGGLLLSCRSARAVSVGPSPVRVGPDKSRDPAGAGCGVEPGRIGGLANPGNGSAARVRTSRAVYKD